MTKLEDLCMTIENKMLGLGLKFYGRTRSLITDKYNMRFGPVEKSETYEVFGDVKLELEQFPNVIVYIDGENYINAMFDDPDAKIKEGL